MKIEVGKKYELNNGEIHECTDMYGNDPFRVDQWGYGPFVINNMLYHQDGTFGNRVFEQKFSGVKREVAEFTLQDNPEWETSTGYDPHAEESGKFQKYAIDREPTTGTLAELNVKPGDVVEYVRSADGYEWQNERFMGALFTVQSDGSIYCKEINDGFPHSNSHTYTIISRASDDTPKTWQDMTDAEKGGSATMEAIEYIDEVFDSNLAQRMRDELGIKPQPVRETVTLTGYKSDGEFSFGPYGDQNTTHRITFDTIDGKPVCDSIKMEALG